MLNDAARRIIQSGALAHLVTINEDGSPQAAIVWVGLDGDELVSAHLDGLAGDPLPSHAGPAARLRGSHRGHSRRRQWSMV